MKTELRAAEKKDFSGMIDFLEPFEFRAITLMSHVCAGGKPVFPSGGGSVQSCMLLRQEQLAGILLLTSTGILFHCLSDTLNRDEARHAVQAWINRARIKCVLGAGSDTLWLEGFLPRAPFRAVDYQLMTMEAMPFPAACAVPDSLRSNPSLRFARATVEDAERLLPLQEGYEKEEVIPPGDPFDRAVCLRNLQKSLDAQIINYYEESGTPIAKVGTNARGLHWDQLGGVFTDPRWRGRGLARSLVARTAAEQIDLGRKTALFVKTGNVPAIRAYTAAGFSPSIPFRISYL